MAVTDQRGAVLGWEAVEKECQFVNWFADLSARPDNSNVKLQMLELWGIRT